MTNDFHNINIHYRNNGDGINMPDNTNRAINNELSGGRNTEKNTMFEHQKKHSSRLNGLDSTILEEEAYQNIDDDILKTEYKITKLSNDLKNIETEIERARSINDYQRVDILTIKKHSIQEKLRNLHKNYKNSDLTAHLSEDISNIFTNRPNGILGSINKCGDFIKQNILRKMFKTVNSGENIKDALNKLETLNKNVDELVTMQAPYGEAEERYEMLTEYLNRANVIHFNISKTIGTPTFFDTISSIDKEKLKQALKEKSNFGNMARKRT